MTDHLFSGKTFVLTGALQNYSRDEASALIATSNSLVEYMQRVKVEAAKQRFESSTDNVNEVMYNVGYNDAKAFRTTFKRFTGLSPVSYRNKYNREFAEV